MYIYDVDETQTIHAAYEYNMQRLSNADRNIRTYYVYNGEKCSTKFR